MRRRASAISAGEPGQRLPVPPARDEIGRLGETLNEMLERLESAFARERTFVSDASHELRTPLSILKTELELALRGGRSVDELNEALRSAADETDRLAQLAEDLLVIARSDQGRLPIRLADVDAREVLEVVRDRYSRRAAERGIRIDVDAPEALELTADALRIEQAIGNLVDNALRYGAGPIGVQARRVDGCFELSVRDHGAGFPPEFIPGAFERFTRADSGRSRGGAGLGLAIVAAIASAHGGSAGAANAPGGGAEVVVRVPATNDARIG
jgi:signal transduction histidine kinase